VKKAETPQKRSARHESSSKSPLKKPKCPSKEQINKDLKKLKEDLKKKINDNGKQRAKSSVSLKSEKSNRSTSKMS